MKKKEYKYIKGRLLPFILLILSVLFVATYFGTFIAGPNNFSVTAWDAMSAAFQYPVIEKLNIDIDSTYYTSFVEPSDVLTRHWTGLSDLLEFMSRYLMILALFVSLFNILSNLFTFIKAFFKGRLSMKLNKNSGSLIINCILGSLAIPAFQPDAPLPLISGTIDFLLFKTHYVLGIFFIAAFIIGLVTFFLPYIWMFILKKRGKNDKIEKVCG